ncbi:hypothetical protein AAFN85_24535 [Mucilaginibacter sp. CAU 1740]|uniref:hypothetical protein n=1 Tax=Mucilaginibacter sp. CAU 1740 TaxID=3140365 RepID=UPI00325B72C6
MAGRFGVEKKILWPATFLSLLVLTGSLLVAGFYFDLSWDGQWYQQAAVYNLAETWNPLFKPMETPDGINHTSILHFPKNTWYFAAAAMRLFNTVEAGKAYNLMILVVAFGVVYSFCRSLGISALRSVIFTMLVLLNPVVWSEITTYLNDGDLYLLLVIYLSAILSWIRDPKRVYTLLSTMAICCLVNVKFTGLVFILIISFFIFCYILIRKRNLIKSFLISHLIAGTIALCIFGFNPYVTNFINRGNPLYPLMGSKQFPGVLDKGIDDNEAYETPKNMMGKSLPVRLLYANFGYPGNAPYNGEDTARLTNPFLIDPKSWSAYHFHETRVSGFGPYFGILLMLAFITLPVLLITLKTSRLPVAIFFISLCSCLLLSKHFWWPRFFPMLWLVPLLPLLLLWIDRDRFIISSGKLRVFINNFAWVFVVVIGINGFIVAVVHLKWETTSSINLRNELQNIHDTQRSIAIDYGYFKRATEEKLDRWNIQYEPILLEKDTTAKKLTSVVNGYPNQILYKFK